MGKRADIAVCADSPDLLGALLLHRADSGDARRLLPLLYGRTAGAHSSEPRTLAGIVAFWLCRLAIQFLVYDSAIWKGRPFYTFMNVAFSFFWVYVVITYSLALRAVWNG